MSTASTFSTSNSQKPCDCGLPIRIRISRTQQNPEKSTCPNSLKAGPKCSFWEWVVEDLVTYELESIKKELVGLRKEVIDVKKKMGGQKCGSNKDSLGSCISVYSHAFAFPVLATIPATKREKGGGGGGKHEA
ncbi:hypothetical protein LXL04_013191 [Taraxacum kok-saghyz]